MFCPKCGTKIEDGGKFCPSCGTLVTGNPVTPVQTDAPAAEGTYSAQAPVTPVQQEGAPNKEKKPKDPNKKSIFKNKFFYIGIASALAILAVVLILVNQPKKFNIEKYIKVTYSGVDGYGKASVRLDKNALKNDIYNKVFKKKSSTDSAVSAIQSYFGSTAQAKQIITAINSIELDVQDSTTGLKNGDKIVVNIKYNNNLAKIAKIKFKGKKYTSKVTGLKEVESLDVFAGLKVTFKGMAPNGYVDISYSGDSRIHSYDFSVEEYSSLKNGDTITVKFKLSDENTAIEGYVATEKEKTYTVDGLDEMMNDVSDFGGFMNTIKGDALNELNSYFEKLDKEEYAVSKTDYQGYSFITNKDDSIAGNRLYVVFSAVITKNSDDYSPVLVYFPVLFSNIKKENGEMKYKNIDGIFGSSAIYSDNSSSYFTIKGYSNPTAAYKKLVKDYESSYNVKVGDGFEKFNSDGKISSVSEIPESVKNKFKEKAVSYIKEYCAEEYTKYDMSDLEFYDEILAYNEGASDFSNYNKYYLIYKSTLTSKDGNMEPTTVYYPVTFTGVIKNTSDMFYVCKFSGIKGSCKFGKGYIDLEKMETGLCPESSTMKYSKGSETSSGEKETTVGEDTTEEGSSEEETTEETIEEESATEE